MDATEFYSAPSKFRARDTAMKSRPVRVIDKAEYGWSRRVRIAIVYSGNRRAKRQRVVARIYLRDERANVARPDVASQLGRYEFIG